MSNDARNQAEIEDVTKALKQQAETPAQGGSAWERTAAALSGVADRGTGWVAARVKDTFQDFVGRVLHGETTSPEPSDKNIEKDRGIDR
jgi:hypothetical protein